MGGPIWAYFGCMWVYLGTVDIGHFRHVSAIAHQFHQGVYQSRFLISAQRFHVSPHLHISTVCRDSTLIQALLATNISTAKAGPLIIISTVAPVFHRLVGMLEKELARLCFDQVPGCTLVANNGLALNC